MGSLAFDSKETKILHIIMEMWPEWSNVREQDLRMELTERFMPQTIHVNQALSTIWEKAMATDSSTLAWKIPWMEEPNRLKSTGSRRVGHLLSDFTLTFHFHALEKEMGTRSSVLAWRIPGTGEPGGLPSMGSHRVRHNWSDLAARG